MTDSMSIQVNFSRPMPIFPLDTVSLLPQQMLPLLVFEPRYRQMVEHVLDTSGQIAMAVFEGDQWKVEYHGRPPIRPAVCIAQIRRHKKLDDGHYDVLVQGICRARVTEECEPDDDLLYRTAMLDPVGLGVDESALDDLRNSLESMLSAGPLTQLAGAPKMVEYLQSEDVPVNTIVEFIGGMMVSDTELRYFLLAEENPRERASMVMREMQTIEKVIGRALRQVDADAPKGCSWN